MGASKACQIFWGTKKACDVNVNTCLSPHCCKTTNPWALAWLSCLMRSACDAAEGEACSVAWPDKTGDCEMAELCTMIWAPGLLGRLIKFDPLRANGETEFCCGWVVDAWIVFPFEVSRGSDLTMTRPGSVLMTGTLLVSRPPKANWNFGSVPREFLTSSDLIVWPVGVSWNKRMLVDNLQGYNKINAIFLRRY